MKAAAIIAVLAVVGCASEPGQGPASPASPVPQLDTSTCPVLHPRYGVLPVFPHSMLRDRREGWVIVGFDVDSDGAATNLHVVKSDPGGVFDVEALRAMATARLPANDPHTGCQVAVEFELSR